MGDVHQALIPEMLGLLATPVAVVACVLLLESERPLADAGR